MKEAKIRKLSHSGSRKKGSRGEYQIRDELIKIGIRAKRIPMSGALAWMKGDVGEFNVQKKHVHEVKNCEKLQLGDWWRQASVQSLDGEIPVLHFTSNHRKFTTVMRAVDFDDMVAAYERNHPELEITLIDYPGRKDFYKFQSATTTGRREAYFWELDGRTVSSINKQTGVRRDVVYPDEQLVIIPTDLYLFLRKYEVVLTAPA